MRMSPISSILMLLLSHAAMGHETRLETSSQPAKPFTVFVYADDNAVAGRELAITEVTDETRKKLRDRNDWFLLSTDLERADIVVKILRHRAIEELKTIVDKRVSYIDCGGLGHQRNTEYLERDVLVHQHSIDVRVKGPGFLISLTGTHPRGEDKGLNSAASDLARRLEEYVKTHYRELLDGRPGISTH